MTSAVSAARSAATAASATGFAGGKPAESAASRAAASRSAGRKPSSAARAAARAASPSGCGASVADSAAGNGVRAPSSDFRKQALAAVLKVKAVQAPSARQASRQIGSVVPKIERRSLP